jgi:hypothetical protein
MKREEIECKLIVIEAIIEKIRDALTKEEVKQECCKGGYMGEQHECRKGNSIPPIPEKLDEDEVVCNYKVKVVINGLIDYLTKTNQK